MKSVLDELNIPASDTHVPFSSQSGMAAVPVDFEEELPESSAADPEAEARYKAINRLAKNDRRGYEALVEEFQISAKQAFIELADVEPTSERVPTLLAKFQAHNESLAKLKSFGCK
ncbi:MAG TPA: hypothetical protein VOA88_10950 [Candidatus Dormibacteraeota bacterium]|nr:hypothetical protein [Candidatus Dormibacteraeota bacterium]